MEKNTEKTEHKSNTTEESFIGKLFWGALLVLIGGILLISNFGLVEVEWSNLFKLWPIFIIAAGLSVLSINNFIWRLISFVMAILVLGVVVWALLFGIPDKGNISKYREIVAVESSTIKSYEVAVQTGAGKINIASADQSDLAFALLDSDVMELKKTSKVESEKQIINFATEAKVNNFWPSNVKNDLEIRLNRNLPLSLKLQVGAADVDVDLAESNLEYLNIKVGASSLKVKLGDKQALSNIYLESGASDISLKLPKDSGVRLKLESGLSAKSMAGLFEVGDGVYESGDYINSTKKINITAKIGVASFKVERY